MNILLLSRYTRLGASSRLRTMQYLPALAREGLKVQVAPFFDDAYLQALYLGKRKRGSTTGHMLQRMRDMRMTPTPDLIWLEYEALPWVPWLIERAILPRGVPIVSDYDDAVFHRYDKHKLGTVQAFLGKKIGRVMAASALVMAGNPYLGDHARRSGATQVELVPTVIDLDAYEVREDAVDEITLRVGWIGTPQTWQELAHPIHGLLDPLLTEHRALFRAVGASMKPETRGTLEILPWMEDTEVSSIQGMDIGVMPLPDTPWAQGKCGYKLIQYMACGLPVVASPVGVNRDIVEHGVNGFLAESDDDWHTAIETLLNDAELRRRMGAAGRRKVEERYSLQVWGPRVARMLGSVIKSQAHG
ncbi:glycosyltransferase family 4 protein [Tateyamaria pelophila]|uniref:glycosyltransferase family 4 protein n=1 Tax=Tateyamaria pelophila TaxID=328415 RepID=UPI001CBB6D70|nr:glycosyltransferase family 4 protein [Tateyamaria pelophila]